MTTMREKLCVAAAVAEGELESFVGFKPGTPEFLISATANYAKTIDAILTTLREPSYEAVREGTAFVPANCDRDTLEHAFAAIIDHIRSGK